LTPMKVTLSHTHLIFNLIFLLVDEQTNWDSDKRWQKTHHSHFHRCWSWWVGNPHCSLHA
jgi:hypothetical protein